MLNLDNINMKEEKSILGEKLEEIINNKYTIRELDLDSVGEILKRSAKYVFELSKIEENLLALLFVNKDYKIKLGLSHIILSSETLKYLSIIVEEFQKIVDDYVGSQRLENIEDKIIDVLRALYSVVFERIEKDNDE